jgi:2-oxoglutarate ferredoxin oxidoreductase subunit gamma
MINERIILSGFGGQGVLSLGQIISLTAMNADKHTTWIPAYGAEMRGGTANVQVIYSDQKVGSPIIKSNITTLIAMNQPSIDKFIEKVVPGGLVLVNSSVITKDIPRDDVEVLYIDATDIASAIGNPMVQNMVMLGTYLKARPNFTVEQVEATFNYKFTGGKAKFIPLNLEAVKQGIEKAYTK